MPLAEPPSASVFPQFVAHFPKRDPHLSPVRTGLFLRRKRLRYRIDCRVTSCPTNY
jgi:hypothetical protein